MIIFFYFIYSFFIFSSFCLFISCKQNSTNISNLKINTPDFNITNESTHFSSFVPITIPIKITNSNGFTLQTNLTEENKNISLPNGVFHVQAGYLAIENKYLDICQTNEYEPKQHSLFYTEYETDFEISEKNPEFNLYFPTPPKLVSLFPFAFKILDSNGTPARYAKVFYEDPISGLKLKDPCSNVPLSDTTDSEGRLAVDLPIYNNLNQLKLLVITEEEDIAKEFKIDFVQKQTNAQFYKLNMFNNSLSLMDEQSESFLEDGFSISYRRDVLRRNPRFPDLPNFIIKDPDFETGFLSLIDNIFDNINVNYFDLITKRKFVVYCRLLKNTEDNQNTVIISMQNCNNPIENILQFIKINENLIIEATLMDSENYIASNKITDTKRIQKN